MDLTALLEAAGMSPAVASLAVLATGYVLTWVAAMLPRPAEGSRWAAARRLLDLVAANVGRARNAAVPAVSPPPSVRTPGLVLALLLGGTALSACATIPANQALQVETARSVLALDSVTLGAKGDTLSPEARLAVTTTLAAAGVAALLVALRDAGVARAGAAG